MADLGGLDDGFVLQVRPRGRGTCGRSGNPYGARVVNHIVAAGDDEPGRFG